MSKRWKRSQAWTGLRKPGIGACMSPQQNGMMERVIHTLKEQGIHRQRFENRTLCA